MSRVPLQDAVVQRAGRTARHWNQETREVFGEANKKLQIFFEINSKGGGITDLQIEIGQRDFVILLKLMCKVDRQAAMKAMAAELALEGC